MFYPLSLLQFHLSFCLSAAYLAACLSVFQRKFVFFLYHMWRCLELPKCTRYIAGGPTEKDLVLEIDRLRHHSTRNGVTQHGKRPKTQTADSSSGVATFIRDLEDERDYWQSQVTELQQLLRSKADATTMLPHQSPSMTGARRSRSTSPTRSISQTPTRRKTVSRATSPVSPARKVWQYYYVIRICCFEVVHKITRT